MNNRFVTLVWALALAPLSAGAESGIAPPDPPDPLPLDWCVQRAAEANPALAADAASADAARHRVGPAGSLEDPRVGYELSNLPIETWDLDSSPLSGHQFRLQQRLPFPGLLRNRREAARAGAEAASADLDDRRVAVDSGVERAWAELGFAQRSLEITDRNVELMRQFVAIAEARYRVGSGLQQDVLRAHVELTSLLQQRLRREAGIRTAGARLGAFLDLAPDGPFPRTTALRDATPVPALADLTTRLEQASPRLRAHAHRIAAAEKRRRATELEGYPDFDLGIGYRLRPNVPGDPVDGSDFVQAAVSVRLPVNRGKWRSRVAEQGALVRRAQAEYRAARAELLDALTVAHAELVRADEELALIETGLLPQARESLGSSRAGYEVGRVDFPNLVDTQINLLEAELRLVRTVADRRGAFAALEEAVGEDLR